MKSAAARALAVTAVADKAPDRRSHRLVTNFTAQTLPRNLHPHLLGCRICALPRQKRRPCRNAARSTKGMRSSLRLPFQQPRLVQVERQDRQLEIGGARVVFVEEQDADIFFPD